MAEVLEPAAAARALKRLRAGARGSRTAERIDQLVGFLEGHGHGPLNLGEVVDLLYPGNPQGVDRFRDLRATLSRLAAALGSDLACHVDGQKHASPRQRRFWFTGTDDQVERLEEMSRDSTQRPAGAVAPVPTFARRARRVCIDGPEDDPRAKELASRLGEALRLDHEYQLEVFDTGALAGERPEEIRAARIAEADVVVCLLTPGYLSVNRAPDRPVVVPVALELLGDRIDHKGFVNPFTLGGKAYSECASTRERFVHELHEQIMGRLQPSPAPLPDDDARWRWQLPSEAAAHAVEALGLPGFLDKEPPQGQALDVSVDVQEHLLEWATGSQSRPYLVIFGEYGMGKTTACQVFTTELLRRRDGDPQTRLPIYLDLRRLAGVGATETPELVEILRTLLRPAWQSGAQQPAATPEEVMELVRQRRAIVIFDGLDEVLVHLTPPQGQAFLRQLWSILPPKFFADRGQRERAGSLIFTCRTHFFATLRDQHTYFRGEEREVVDAQRYEALHLLPFTPRQVRAYLERRTPGDLAGVERAVALISQVHNLSELVARPFNLRLVAEQLGALERRVARGDRVDASALYEELVKTWLERDEGKHQLEKRHKLRLMEDLAALLWGTGRRSLPADRLEAWLLEKLAGAGDLGTWFQLGRPDVSVLAEDLRTATFVVRPGAEDFEFAHTSLLEYFLARFLARCLQEGDVQGWALPIPSTETLDFLGEILAGGDTDRYLTGLRSLRAPYRPLASELAFAYCIRALDRGMPGLPLTGFALEGARLRGVQILGSADGPLLPFTDCVLRGADLRDTRVERVRLEGCDLTGARLERAELHGCLVRGTTLTGAELSGLIVRDCRVAGLDLRAAVAHRTQWLECTAVGCQWPVEGEAHLFTGAGAGPAGRRTPEFQTASLAAFTGHRGEVISVAWSPDGTRLATAGRDGSARVWDVASGEELLHLPSHVGRVESVAWSPDGTRLASAGREDGARVWDSATGEELLRLPSTLLGMASVAWSPDGTRLATAGWDGAQVWDAASGEELLRLTRHPGKVESVAWSPDGTRLATTGGRDDARVWDAASGEELLRLPGHTGRVESVAWSPDGTRLATAGWDGVWVWDAASGEELLRLPDHPDGAESVAWSPDGTRLATTASGDAWVWDAASGEQLLRLTRPTGRVVSVAWAVDGTRLATAGGDAWVWDAASGEQLLRLTRPTGTVSVAWSPDGTRLATAGGDGVRVWDAASGEELLRLRYRFIRVVSVAWSPDGTRLATAGEDRVQVWDAASGEQLSRLSGHPGVVESVAWSPDGTRLATAGGDAARLWDAASAQALVTFQLLPGGESAVLEPHRVLRCSPGAWRWLGWLAPSPWTGRVTRYPAETFGPLPVGR